VLGTGEEEDESPELARRCRACAARLQATAAIASGSLGTDYVQKLARDLERYADHLETFEAALKS
jgi:hypothetical protein